MRVAFLAAEAMPFLRRYSIAFSMSAAVSVSAFLQSAIPAPVRSRRSLIICAVTSAMTLRPLREFASAAALRRLVFGGGGRLGLRQLAATARHHLDARALAPGRDADGLALVAALGCAGAGLRRPLA